jgi:hypothetical protein
MIATESSVKPEVPAMPTQFSFAGREIRPWLSRKLHFHGVFRDQPFWLSPCAVFVPVAGNLRYAISGATQQMS